VISAAPSSPRKTVAAAFDALAARYDAEWTDAPAGRAQREQVWRVVGDLFRAGERVLDLGCGTGADAVRLARRGISVHAVDVAPEMLAAARRRLEAEGTGSRVRLELRALEDLAALRERGPFDGALSNFGALNCVADLPRLASDLSELVRPGGRVAVCVFGRFCLWEVLWYLARGDAARALRRRRGVTARSGFAVFYPPVAALTAAFRPWFRCLEVRGVGVFVPPSYAASWANLRPRLLGALDRLDRVAGRAPGLRALSDHVLVVFERS
jgi:ubiquinone/menaquinone biosynthesis C-methylase UbiE